MARTVNARVETRPQDTTPSPAFKQIRSLEHVLTFSRFRGWLNTVRPLQVLENPIAAYLEAETGTAWEVDAAAATVADAAHLPCLRLPAWAISVLQRVELERVAPTAVECRAIATKVALEEAEVVCG